MGGSTIELKPIFSPITKFCGGTIQPMGSVNTTVELGDRESGISTIIKTTFNILNIPLAYNRILRRPILYEIKAVTDIKYLIMKIPLKGKVITIKKNKIKKKIIIILVNSPLIKKKKFRY